jgi:feruloyl esterase
MRSRWYLVMTTAALFVMGFVTTRPAHSTPTACESLAGAELANTTITLAQPVTEGSFTPTGAPNAITDLPPFCRVAGVIAPTSESQIRFEVWLPLTGWSG